MAIQIKRGKEELDPSISNVVLLDGQLFYSNYNNRLYIGKEGKALKDQSTITPFSITSAVSPTSMVTADDSYDAVSGPAPVTYTGEGIFDGENWKLRPNETIQGAKATGTQSFAWGGRRYDDLNGWWYKMNLNNGLGAVYYDFQFYKDAGNSPVIVMAHYKQDKTKDYEMIFRWTGTGPDADLESEYSCFNPDADPFNYPRILTTALEDSSLDTLIFQQTEDSDPVTITRSAVTAANGPQSVAFGGGNVANAKWDFTAGKVNTVNSALSFVYGSANKVGVAGKDENAQQNNIIVGAVNKVGRCPSSLIVGDTLYVNMDSTGDCKTGAVIGQSITATEFSQGIIAGRLHQIDGFRTYAFGHNHLVSHCADEAKDNNEKTGKVAGGDNIISGESNVIRGGRNNALFGCGVRIGSRDDATEVKTYSSVVAGNGCYANWAKHCVVAGNYCGVQGSSSSYVTNTFVFGSGLRTMLSNAFIIGKNHSDVDGARFIIGNGESETSRSNLITVTDDQTSVRNDLTVKDKIQFGQPGDPFHISFRSIDAKGLIKAIRGLEIDTDQMSTTFISDVYVNGQLSGPTITRIDEAIDNEKTRAQNTEQELATDITNINNTFTNFDGRNILTGTIDNGALTINLVSYHQATI